MSGSNDAGRLLVRIEATTAQLRQQLQAAEAQVAGTSAKIDQQLKKADQAFDRMNLASRAAQDAVAGLSARLGPMGSLLGSLGAAGVVAGAGVAALGVGLTAVAKAGDVATGVLARLASATGSAAQAQQVYERLFELSQQTGIAVAESAGSFARFSVAAKEIGGTNDQVLKLVAGIQKAGIVAGASAQETGAAVWQLGQALASGVLQGDELRSLLENMPQLAQSLARELGVGIGQLRQMGSEGKLTADLVFPALLRASEKMNAEFEKMPPTMGRAFGILGESMARFGADLDRALGLSRQIAAAAKDAADAVNRTRRSVLPTEREAAEDAARAAQTRIAEARARIVPDEKIDASFSREADRARLRQQREQSQAALRQAESDLRTANDRLLELDREGNAERFGEYVTGQRKAQEAARQSADRAYKTEREKWDKDYKLREDHRKRVEAIDKAETTGAISSMEATRDRARANEDLREGLEKTADTVGKVADGHRRVAKEADDANAHVKAYLKDQQAAADAVVAAQEKAAEAIRRFHERSFDAVLNIGERAFDRLGDALVDAFVSGQGAAVNFGGVLKAVMASALADIAKLAVVNPILNSLFTSSKGPRETLAGAFGGSATSFGGIGDLLGLGNLMGGESIGSMLGLTGAGGLFGTTIINGIGPATGAALGGMGGAYGPASLAQLNATGIMGFGGSGATLGGLLGGAGAGFGAGMFLNQMLGGNQTSGMIGSGLGSAAGAIIGSIIPGIGTLIGGLIGGAAGGGLGGLIGPGESVKGWSYAIRSTGPDDGWSQGDALKMDNVFYNESGKAQFDQANATIAAVNEYLASAGLTVGGARAVGGNKDGPDDSWGGAASFGDAFATLKFQSKTDDRLTAYLGGQTFDDPAKLQQAVEGFKAAAAAIDALGAESIPAFTASLKAVNDNFDAGVEQAKKYGLAEENLTAARAKALDALQAQRVETLRQSDVSLYIRGLTAAGNTQQAELARQAEAAGLELKAFGEALDAMALPAEQRAARLLALEETQAAERLAIIQRYGEQAAAALDRNLNAGQSLLRDLTFGGLSALAPEQQYFAALTTLNRARQDLDGGGDLSAYTAVASQVLPVARDYLGTSQRYAGLAAEVGKAIAGRGGDTAGLSQILSAQVGSTDALQATFASYGAQHLPIASATLAEVKRLASVIEALISRQQAA